LQIRNSVDFDDRSVGKASAAMVMRAAGFPPVEEPASSIDPLNLTESALRLGLHGVGGIQLGAPAEESRQRSGWRRQHRRWFRPPKLMTSSRIQSLLRSFIGGYT
jgi:hypothetical protein